jgi:hypothetical protein
VGGVHFWAQILVQTCDSWEGDGVFLPHCHLCGPRGPPQVYYHLSHFALCAVVNFEIGSSYAEAGLDHDPHICASLHLNQCWDGVL